MKVIGITYNWRVISDGCQTIEAADEYNVGCNGVVEILEHEAKGEGDKWFYTARFDDGREQKVFNPNTVLSIPIVT